MCKSISFISGKGGSGKTTLALSMASMLSTCGIKTLLIDCDMSTNGATYFHEDKLSMQKNTISFYDIIFNESNKKTNTIKINDNYDFIPSITQITKKNNKTYTHSNNDRIISYYLDWRQRYDVVLFDCQAGYTDILKLILPITDINLSVMETDAISSSAMRSLYLKIGDILNTKKTYQIFSKASKEEYDIYSKVSGGTVFTNIEIITFDWKIRKAFSVSRIPDMESTSANYGQQVYNICSILLNDETNQTKLSIFKNILELHFLNEQEELLEKEICELKENYQHKKKKKTKTIYFSVLSFLIILGGVFVILAFKTEIFDSIWISTIFSLAFSFVVTIMSTINIFEFNKEGREYEKSIKNNEEKLVNTILDKKRLQNLITEQKNDSTN